MNRQRAETYLRLLGEAELRRVMARSAGSAAGRWHARRLELAAQALSAVDAVDAGAAGQIRADIDRALAARQLSRPGTWPTRRGQLGRLMQAQLADGALPSRSARRPASPRGPWRVAPVGHAVPGDGSRGELLLLAYVHTAAGARFTVAIGMAASLGMPGPGPGPGRPAQPRRVLPAGPLTATDDRGAAYQLLLQFGPGFGAGVLELRPDPPPGIGRLDLATAPGQPATRIDLTPPGPPVPAAQVTVTRPGPSPGELMLDVIAARILTSVAPFSQDDPGRPAAASADLRAFIGDGPGHIVAALHAVGALSPDSPVPGQLAGLCARLGIPGHGITAPPAAGLPPRWHSMLASSRRGPHPVLPPGSWAATTAQLPDLDGVTITILGLHHGESGTIMHLLVSGVTPDGDWAYGRGVRPLPALWIRDSGGRWHATRTRGVNPCRDTGEVVLRLAIVPPLDRGTIWIDLAVAGPSAEVRARLPLRWQ
jgi:hypothetical protein